MIKTVRDAWKIPELRKKILFTISGFRLLRLRQGKNRSCRW